MQFHEFVEALCRGTDRVVVNLVRLGRSSGTSSEKPGLEVKDKLVIYVKSIDGYVLEESHDDESKNKIDVKDGLQRTDELNPM